MKFLTVIADYFSYLMADSKFEIYQGKALGKTSGFILLRNEKIKIKIVSHRNQNFVEIGSNQGVDWCDLSIIRYYLDKTPITPMEAFDQSAYLKTNLKRIENTFSSDENIKHLEELKYEIANRAPLTDLKQS